uniref:Uncharacterized protein n=1 Tax=Tanacetum cinerariifolium TaxID=118510 RepID=A0A699GP39_TANCI|nr:hypothetical protein [Tanacetum cinerariifolium]
MKFSYHKIFDILKQYQNEVNELRAEKLARNANPLALVATAQADRDPYYQTSRSHRSHAPSSKPSIPSRSHTSTKHKGKEITKPSTPPSETASEEDSDPEQAQKDKDMQKNLALIAKYFKKIYKPTNNNLRISLKSKNKNVDTTPREKVGSQVVQKSGIQCFNYKEYGHFAKECRKPKRVKDSTWMKKLMNKNWKHITCTWLRSRMFLMRTQAQIQSQWNSNPCLVETDDSNVTPNSPDMCEDDIQNEQNDVESDDERVALANLIANLKIDVDENKKIQKQLKKANTTLAQELKECKAILAKTNALAELQCMYIHKVKECDCLAQKLSKQTDSVSKKKLIEKGKGKTMDTKFDRPSVVRQPNAQRIPKPSVLGKLTPFSDSLKRKYFPKTNSVPKNNVSESLSKPVTAQTLTQTAKKDVSNTNVLRPGMYRIDNKTAHTRAPQLP